jgi:Flp pilus assembly pilin Flp
VKKAQSTLEYAIITAVVVAALLSMSTYIKRSLQGGFKQQADNFGSQYAPRKTTSDIIFRIYSQENTVSDTIEQMIDGKNKLITTTDFDSSEVSTRKGSEDLAP